MIVKYFLGIAIHMENVFQFRNFSMKCKQVVTHNKNYIEKTLNQDTFQNPRANCIKLRKVLVPVGFLYTLVITLRSLLEDNQVWMSRSVNLCGLNSQLSFKLRCRLLRKLRIFYIF